MKQTDILIIREQTNHKLSVATSEGYTLIDCDTILYLKADNNYTTFYLTDNTKIITSKNLGYFEQKLLKKSFIRTHHSFIVNISKIVKYVKSGNGHVVLTNKELLPVSRKRKVTLLKFFEQSL